MSLLLWSSMLILILILLSIYIIVKLKKGNSSQGGPYHNENFNHFINTLKKVEKNNDDSNHQKN